MDIKVYIDLDGVLVDLEAGYKSVIGNTLSQSHIMGKTGKEMWEEIEEKDPNFWLMLNPTKECNVILAYLEYLYSLENLYVLTAAVKTEKKKCIEHKKRWVDFNTEIAYRNTIVCMRHEKQDYASGNILIDDNMLNINEWNSKGGVGIHYVNFFKLVDDLKNITLHNKIRG